MANGTTNGTDNNTIQTSIKHTRSENMSNYALFLGGVNATHDALNQYDPLKTGYGRIFCVQAPVFVSTGIPNAWKRFKHIMEYGNTAIGGIGDATMSFGNLQGGYVGKQFEIPSHIEDSTNSFNIKVYEFSGSPVREVIHYWLNGISDINSGLCHYNGVKDIPKCQANQTSEWIYVSTDNTGEEIEYACLFANAIPKTINNEQFNYNSGEHTIVDITVEFTTTKYESIQINGVAAALLKKFRVLTNSMNFYSGYKADTKLDDTTLGGREGFAYNPNSGLLDKDYASMSSVSLNTPRAGVALAEVNQNTAVTYTD